MSPLFRGGKIQSYRDLILSHSPVAYWRLGEASGIVAADEMGANNGTYTPNSAGAWTGGTLGQTGIVGAGGDKAALFNGSSGYVRVPDFSLPNGRTYEGWIYANAFGTGLKAIIAKRSNMTGGGNFIQEMVLYSNTAHQLFFVLYPGPVALTANTVMVVGQWYHFACVNDGAAMRIYLNGQVDGSTAYSSSVNNGDGPYHIGDDGDLGRYWNGRIDEVAIYNRALSAAEILAHYNKGAGL